jgi:hypothetical protein
LWKMFVRPFGLILLPPVLWATLVMSVLVGFAVALSSACELMSRWAFEPAANYQ